MIKPIIIEENIDPIKWDNQLAYLKDKTELSINNCINYKGDSELMQILRDSSIAINIILIDTEAEIVAGNLGYKYDLKDPKIRRFDPSDVWLKYLDKVIASSNKSHNLPDLSNESKLLLFNYYNKHKCMPESVEVETERMYLRAGKNKHLDSYEIKLNQQGEVDITILKVEEKLYTEEEVEALIYNCASNFSLYSLPNFKGKIQTSQEWFNNNKK